MHRKRSLFSREAKEEIKELVKKIVAKKMRELRLALETCPYCDKQLGRRKIVRVNSDQHAHFVCFVEADKRDEAMMFGVTLLYPSNAIDIAIERELELEAGEASDPEKAKVIPLRSIG